MPLALKMVLVPAIKIILLGFLKTFFILIGATIMPIVTLRFILGGASGVVVQSAEYLRDTGYVDDQTLHELETDLDRLKNIKLSRSESRAVLMSIVRKTVVGMKTSLVASYRTIGSTVSTFIGKLVARLKS